MKLVRCERAFWPRQKYVGTAENDKLFLEWSLKGEIRKEAIERERRVILLFARAVLFLFCAPILERDSRRVPRARDIHRA